MQVELGGEGPVSGRLIGVGYPHRDQAGFHIGSREKITQILGDAMFPVNGFLVRRRPIGS